ncbi:DUF4404 family protein [Parendozoicomonas haliclonae]|uniref:DUF4404 family protein n=1 Tax=Parendozoicomonas haliclonae TaxID=1960125 RepID=A0A1X7AJG4_9GAMM|nr:DUF4404 family protein [Parendozoicomonas haliclonae]SMA45906.1 hypothetical protein EHSB41UT_02030 [Parendozoicomonas haliclonae]
MSEELQLRIQTLHDMLEGQPVDECTAATLRQVTNDLQIALAQAEGTIPEEAYNEELEKAAIEFAEDHPAIAQVIRQIMNTLGNIGI